MQYIFMFVRHIKTLIHLHITYSQQKKKLNSSQASQPWWEYCPLRCTGISTQGIVTVPFQSTSVSCFNASHICIDIFEIMHCAVMKFGMKIDAKHTNYLWKFLLFLFAKWKVMLINIFYCDFYCVTLYRKCSKISIWGDKFNKISCKIIWLTHVNTK